jgi:prevent-host-death family protein
MQESIGVRELNQHTRQVLDQVRAGDSVIVTDRGRPVARIVPYSPSPYESLVADGQVTSATRTTLHSPPTEDARPTAVVLEELREERA